MPKFKKGQMPRWLKSKPKTLSFAADQVDSENGVIKDVVMCEVGEAKGHGVELEQEFIDLLIAYDQEHFQEIGVKVRFGHPALSDTTMGKQMGKFLNFRVRDNQAIADLHLLKSADLSPTNPGMREWMLSMSKEATDFVMCSIVFEPDHYYQYDDENEQVDAFFNEDGSAANADDGGWLMPRYDDRPIYVKFGKHHYTDMVEAGAATNSLFSEQFNQDKFAVRAIEWVRENEDIHQFLQANPTKLTEFAQQLGVELPKQKVTFSDKWKALRDLFVADGGDEGEELTTALSQITDLQAQLQQASDTAATQLAAHTTVLQGLNLSHQTEISTHLARIAELEKEVTELKAFVPEGHTAFEKKPLPLKTKNTDTVFARANEKAKAIHERRAKK